MEFLLEKWQKLKLKLRIVMFSQTNSFPWKLRAYELVTQNRNLTILQSRISQFQPWL